MHVESRYPYLRIGGEEERRSGERDVRGREGGIGVRGAVAGAGAKGERREMG